MFLITKITVCRFLLFFFSSGYKFDSLFCFFFPVSVFGCLPDLSLHKFLAIMQVLVIQCRHLVLRNSFVVSPVLQSKDLLLFASCVISRVLVLQSQDLLLPALLNDAGFFALIIEKFLGNFIVLSFVSYCVQ